MTECKKSTSKNVKEGYLHFSQRLSELILEAAKSKVTQENIAEYVGCTRQAISQWKDGKTSPDIVSLGKLADYFNVSVEYLMGRSPVKSADIEVQEICEKLGLSEKAVNTLLTVNISQPLEAKLSFLIPPITTMGSQSFVRFGSVISVFLDIVGINFFVSINQFSDTARKMAEKKEDIDAREDIFNVYPDLYQYLLDSGCDLLFQRENYELKANNLRRQFDELCNRLMYVIENGVLDKNYNIKDDIPISDHYNEKKLANMEELNQKYCNDTDIDE